MDIFMGTLTLDDGARVPVDVGLDDENLTLRTDGQVIGTWPLKYCRVSRSAGGAVILSLDGEKAVFEPAESTRFSTAAAQRLRASPLADRIGVIRGMVEDEQRTGRAATGVDGSARILSPRQWAIAAAVAVGVVLVGLVAAFWPETEEATDAENTTIVVTSTAVPPSALFDQTLDEFTTEWNLAAAAFGVPVQIRGSLMAGQFESQITEYLTLQGRTDADGTVGSILLVIDPSGNTEDDERALSALGVAIAVANPELERDERGEVLETMGLSVRDPDLEGLDGEVRVGGNLYTLAYFAEFNALLFSVTPA
ncbi:MAG: hypothetical protein WD990_03745 [Acidimicrobiia bacterium]